MVADDGSSSESRLSAWGAITYDCTGNGSEALSSDSSMVADDSCIGFDDKKSDQLSAKNYIVDKLMLKIMLF
jgi:hypothetical protein